MAKLQHYFQENGCYFVTTTTCGRSPVFTNSEYSLILWNLINYQREREALYLLGFVIMPDHLHLLIIPRGDIKLPWIIREIKKGSARLINKAQDREGKLWMDQYYDYMVRDEKDLLEKMNYIHNNPVKRGLVQDAEKYRFSSANPVYEPILFKEW